MGAFLCSLFGLFCPTSSPSSCSGSLPSEPTWYTTTNPPDLETLCPPETTSADYFADRSFDRVLEDFEQTTTLTLQGSAWDNTLIRNCFIHDTDRDGILLRNVVNVVIANCTFENIGGLAAVRGSVTGSTDRVLLIGNTVRRVNGDGFMFGQRIQDSVDHTNLQIIGNDVSETGLTGGGRGLTHGLYIQGQDFYLSHNTISGSRDGNGISVRSSGTVVCNTVTGVSQTDKPAIRYFSDHQRGPSNTLRLGYNTVPDATIDLFEPAPRFDQSSLVSQDHVVQTFLIRGNRGSLPDFVSVACDYGESLYTVMVEDNFVVVP